MSIAGQTRLSTSRRSRCSSMLPGAFEFLEDHLIHAAAGIDQGRCQNRQAAAFLDTAGGAEKAFGLLHGVGIETAAVLQAYRPKAPRYCEPARQARDGNRARSPRRPCRLRQCAWPSEGGYRDVDVFPEGCQRCWATTSDVGPVTARTISVTSSGRSSMAARSVTFGMILAGWTAPILLQQDCLACTAATQSDHVDLCRSASRDR